MYQKLENSCENLCVFIFPNIGPKFNILLPRLSEKSKCEGGWRNFVTSFPGRSSISESLSSLSVPHLSASSDLLSGLKLPFPVFEGSL